MVTIIATNGVTLSAHATINDLEYGIHSRALFPKRGDFASREGGRMRRKDRRNAIARKRAFLMNG